MERACRRPDCTNIIPESAHSNRRYCGDDECEKYRRRTASKRAYYRNREERAEQIKEYNRNNRAAERKRYHERYRVRRLARTYNVPMERMQEVLDIKACEICGTTDDLVIDHDHETHELRGRLCQSCNRGIGLIGESVEILLAAIEYLTRGKHDD